MSGTTDARAIRCALEDIDAQAQGGFSSIETLARLALAHLESPAAYRHMDWLAVILETIASRASDTQNCINSEAERVGCNYVGGAQRRRRDAEAVARAALVTGRT